MSVWTMDRAECLDLAVATKREWILTNGIGGYAMGTVGLVNTRRYHGHMVAATDPPTVRTVLLASVEATARAAGKAMELSSNQYPGVLYPDGQRNIVSFAVGEEAIWRFEAARLNVRKRIRMHAGKNAVTVAYKNEGDAEISLVLRPLVCHKFYHANFRESETYPDDLEPGVGYTAVIHAGVSLVLNHPEATRHSVHGWYYRFQHDREAERGLDPLDDLYCPCELHYTLKPGMEACLFASTVASEEPLPEAGHAAIGDGMLENLLQAADKFAVRTSKRTSIIAGYPWFTDWGRDTMIALPGVCLSRGQFEDARNILSDYASQSFQGLIPNRFVDQGERPDYNTCDATLWFANAVYKTLMAEWRDGFAREMQRVLADMIAWHERGTLYGICVDPADGLLTQGQEGQQLTWMDAKVDETVITPRHGKPVEVNGLWINALRVLEWLSDRLQMGGTPYRKAAERAEASFARKFFRDELGYYADTVDPLDTRLRPNQVIAMALPFGPANGELASAALDVVAKQLLTPRGLRTLGPQEKGYRGRFEGPMSELDSAYHQGTVWPWLLGQYATALVRVRGDRDAARKALEPAMAMLTEYGIGGIAEVYDGDEPQRPNGCPWQAWSVAEILRAWLEDCTEARDASASHVSVA